MDEAGRILADAPAVGMSKAKPTVLIPPALKPLLVPLAR